MRFLLPTRAHTVPTLAILAVLLLAGLLLAPACLAQEPTPTETPLEYAYIPPGDPDVVSIIYRFTDFGGDWQSLAPELGPIGSIHFYRWEAFHTGPGQFDWNAIDVQLAKEANLKVTLLNGQIIPKPVVLQVIPYLSSNPDRPTWTAVFYDSTPEWVYREIEAATGVTRPVVGGRKVGYVMYDQDYTAVMPMYDNAIWQRYHREMIAALGARYNSHPQITAVSISTGLDGETHATKDYMGGWNAIVDAQYPGVRGCFTNFVLSCMDHYRAAFPNKPLFVNNAPGASGMRWQSSLYASQIEPVVGLRHCGMWEDLQGHQGGGTFIGLWDHIRQYSMTLPIWLESPYGWGAKDTKYWSWLAGLHYHPDAIDVHREWLTDTSPEMLRWVSARLGVTIEDTPSVWTALRDTMYPILDWGTGQSSGHLGDWTFWLTRQEIAGGGTVRVWREELPQACRGQLYSTQARRTDQANGQTYMYFDIDDAYPYVGEVPLSEPNGTVSFSVKVIFLNRGTDTLSLQYPNYAGQIVSRTLTKGPSLGPVGTFISHTFTLEDAYFNNGLGSGTSDFRLSCNGDGDEVVHFIEVTGLRGHFPTPTPSRTPTRTPTRTATPTATRTPTNTPTSTPTATPVAANATAVIDASILQSAPSTNTGDAQTLTVSATGNERSLLYFNLGQLPVGAGIVEARLRLRSTSTTGDPVPILVYGLKRDWQESEVTWERADATSPWALAGADSPQSDRDRAASASAVVSGGQIWYEWDVTELVNAWVKGEQSNHGLLLLASESSGGTYTFASSESANAPQLTFHYALATLTPTYTPTATATRTPTPGPTNTPSPTMAPTPTLVPGGVIFTATADTYISDWFPADNYCRDPKLTVRKGDIVSSLIYFDLSSIPLGTTINGAWLNLYCTNRTNIGEMNALAYKVRRPWVDCEANWTMASSSLAWTVAGCNGEGTDRDQSAVGGLYLNSANSWWTLNLTQAVRDWVANPSTNHGLVFKGYGNVSVEYSFASADYSRPEFRPQLVISAGPLPPTYTPTATASPGPTATRTATHTPSITPTPTNSSTPAASPTASASPTATATPTASPTATATATAGPSPTPSNTPPASPTPTATETPLPTATHTPEPTATPTATEYVAPTPTPPDGGVRFDPIADTTLNAWGPSENLGDESELLLRQPDVRSALLAFDTRAIPVGSSVYKATLNIYVDSRTNIGSLFASAYAVKRRWVESEATWDRARVGVPWQLAGCNGGADRDQTAASTEILDLEDFWFNLDVTTIVQQWVDNPTANYGLILRAVSTALVEYELSSRESSNPLKVPHLYVRWGAETPTPVPPTPSPSSTAGSYPPPATATATLLPTSPVTPSVTPSITPGPSPTPTATFLPTPTPGFGALMIPVSRDTYMNEWNIDKNYGSAPELQVRKEGVKAALLHIPITSVPQDEFILSAKLHLYVTERSNTGIMFASAHEVLRPWAENTASWVLATAETEWQASGCKQVGVDRSGAVVDEIELNASGTWVAFDITTAVRHWVTNPASNYGLFITADGTVYVEYFFASRENESPALRPWVEVLHSKASPVPTHTPTITPTPTITRTPTPWPSATPRDIPTPQPGQITITSGSDAILNAWVPTENSGIKSSSQVRQGNIKATLIRFNLEDLPADLAMTQARLRLQVIDRSNYHDLTLQVYRVRRDWRERDANWYVASQGAPWSVAGCDGTGGASPDRDATPIAQVTIPEPGTWFEIDITAVVTDWLSHPDENYGLLLEGEGPVSVEYQFGSFENEDPALRPVLVVLRSPQTTPTLAAPTTPTPIIGGETFDQGDDAAISAWFPVARFGDASILRLRNNDAMSSLVRFDLTDLPPQSTIDQALMQLYVLGRSNAAPVQVNVYRVVRPWKPSETSWERASALVRWAALGCNASTDRELSPVTSFTLDAVSTWVTVDITSLVRYWTQHPTENYGLVLKTGNGTPVSYDLVSFNHPQVAARPRLVSQYVAAPATPTPTPLPPLTTVVLNAVADTDLNEWSKDTNYGSTAYLPLRTYGLKRPLFRFDLSALPAGAVVTQATFKALTLGTTNYSMNVEAVGLVRPWNEYQATWNVARSGVAWSVPGAEGAGTDRLATPVSSRVLLGSARWWDWDVTSLVRDWASGALANNGLMLVTRDTNVQQQVDLAPRENGRPAQLTVSYFVADDTTVTLALQQGYNMFSVPLVLDEPSLDQVMAPIRDRVVGVWGFDADNSADPWQVHVPDDPVNSLTRIDPRMGYWIKLSADATLTLTGSPPPKTITLKAGWNLIGYPSLVQRDPALVLADIAGQVNAIWFFDATDTTDGWRRYSPSAPAWANNLKNLTPTQGYWILVEQDCTLVVP